MTRLRERIETDEKCERGVEPARETDHAASANARRSAVARGPLPESPGSRSRVRRTRVRRRARTDAADTGGSDASIGAGAMPALATRDRRPAGGAAANVVVEGAVVPQLFAVEVDDQACDRAERRTVRIRRATRRFRRRSGGRRTRRPSSTPSGRTTRTDSRRCAARSSCARDRGGSRPCRSGRCWRTDSGSGRRRRARGGCRWGRAPTGLRRFRSQTAFRRSRTVARVDISNVPKVSSSMVQFDVRAGNEPALFVELAVVRLRGLRHRADQPAAGRDERAVDQPAVGEQPRRADDERSLCCRYVARTSAASASRVASSNGRVKKRSSQL